MQKRLALLILTLTSALSACGFHLRGSESVMAIELKTLHIQSAQPGSEVTARLVDQLGISGVTLVDNSREAEATLTLGAVEQTRRTLSIGSYARAAEYELISRVPFSLTDREGRPLLSQQTAEITKTYAYDQDEVVGKASEERMLREEMNVALAQQILRRIQSYRPDAGR